MPFLYKTLLQPPSRGITPLGGTNRLPDFDHPSDSPFFGLATTAQLTFRVNSGVASIDPTTGVEIAQHEDLVINAFLQQEEDANEVEVPGANATSVFMTGYCVSPMIFPEGIAAGQIAEYTMKPTYGPEVKGDFILHRIPPSPFDILQEVVGDEIEGYLNVKP